MSELLWLIPTIPLFGYLTLAMAGRRLSRPTVARIGVGSVAISAVLTALVGAEFLTSPGTPFRQELWLWVDVGSFHPAMAFYLDALSLTMVAVVTGVGFLIHLYSAEFMKEEEGYSRFFAYMNLFVGSMLILVLADNLLLLYLGWEGVGLCSYLLIGFWYRDPANGAAARKAFIVTRVGDTALAIGLFVLYASFQTLDIQGILTAAPGAWPRGSGLAVASAALLLGGAVGKSAQLPLQTWLPDAMAGPTPVSALIHAATMVTAGVYLIARTHVLFALAPAVQTTVAIIGTLTLLGAGFAALAQVDIKRVLAYSTISQIGYMFLALGLGAYSAAMFHFMTHAFFKALLFLAAGVLIHSLHHEHNMFKMGGLRKLLPLTYWTFLIGGASLAALPLVTAGFYSKDQILWLSWSAPQGGALLWLGAIVGAFITAVYTFRMVFVTFFGEPKLHPEKTPGLRMAIPLVVLAFFSLVGGFLETPETLGHITVFSDFLHTAVPSLDLPAPAHATELLFQGLSAAASLGGLALAYLLYLRRRDLLERWLGFGFFGALRTFWSQGWGFDRLYALLFVRPYVAAARWARDDRVDRPFAWIARLAEYSNHALRRTQTGRVRTYLAGIALGAVLILAAGVLL